MRWPRTALSLLVGCGSAQAVQPSPPPVEVLPASAPQPEGTAGEEKPSARAITGYPPPVEPPPVACRLTGKWESDQPHALALQPSGAIFATFHAPTHAEVTLGEAPSSAFVELSSEHIRLVGFVPGDKLLLHAAQPFLVAGFAAPGAGAALRWIGASSGSVSIEVGLPGHARARIPVRDRRACDEVRLDSRAAFDPVAAIDGAAGSAATLAGGQAIVLQAEPGRRPLAELRFDKEGDAVVDVIERRQLHARIVVHPGSLNPLDQVVLVGWVQASSLRPRSGGQGGSWASGGSRGTPRPPRRRDANEVQCPHEVPLVAGLGGERRLVGALAANQRLDVVHAAGSGSEDLVEVTVRDAPVEPAAGVRFFAKRSALSGCADAAGAASSTHAR